MLGRHRAPRRTVALLCATAVAFGGLVGAVGVAGTTQAAVGDPTVKTLSVTKGSSSGGTSVLINGTGFATVDDTTVGATPVMFGTTAATSFILISDTQIAAKAPAGTGGTTVDVFVTNATGTNAAGTTTGKFQYLAPITVVVPTNTLLSAAGGTNFVAAVSGSSVTSNADITTNKITATVNGAVAKVAYGGATDTLTITAPAGIPTITGNKVTVSVLNNGVTGTVDNTHATYVAVITKLSVVSGPTAGTAAVAGKPAITITGVGFANADVAGWTFGASNPTAASCTNTVGKVDTSVTCPDIPLHAAGPVTVSFTFTNGVIAGVTAGATYTYTDVG